MSTDLLEARESVPVVTLPVLVIEDNPADAVIVREMLRDFESTSVRFDLVHADRLEAGVHALLDRRFACVLLDLSLPDAEGLEALSQVRTAALDVPIILLIGGSTGTGKSTVATEVGSATLSSMRATSPSFTT